MWSFLWGAFGTDSVAAEFAGIFFIINKPYHAKRSLTDVAFLFALSLLFIILDVEV